MSRSPTGPGTHRSGLDALHPGEPGRYTDVLVEVVRRNPDQHADLLVRTPHFGLRRPGGRLQLVHDLPADELDNEVAGLLADELFAPGWLDGADVFERVFTGVVKTTLDDPLHAWNTFYDNTLSRIRRSWTSPEERSSSSIEQMVPVYRRCLELTGPGRVLDLGSCFGFLAILLAERPSTEVIASDIEEGTVQLLRSATRARNLTLGTLICDAARVPLPRGAVDTVVAVHLLEHLEHRHGAAVLAEAARIARRRVVAAVPFEDVPTRAYGHVRTFDRSALDELGAATGLPYRTEEHHGGWLILDTR